MATGGLHLRATRRLAPPERFACLITTLHFLPAHALAGGLPDRNLACTAGGTQDSPQAWADGAGGLFVAWQDWWDYPGGPVQVFALRMLDDGTRAWATGGIAIGVTTPEYLGVRADGAGGAIRLWIPIGVLHARHLTAAGDVAPAGRRVGANSVPRAL